MHIKKYITKNSQFKKNSYESDKRLVAVTFK